MLWFIKMILLEKKFMKNGKLRCDTPKPEGLIDHRQPAETCVSHIMRPYMSKMTK